MFDFIHSLLAPFYARYNLSAAWAGKADQALSLIAFVVIVLLTAWVASLVLTKIVQVVVKNTKTLWDDYLFESGFFRRLSRQVPAFVAYAILPSFFPPNSTIDEFIRRFVIAYSAIMLAHVGAAFLDGFNLIYQNSATETAKRKPIKSYLQLIKVFLYIVGGILAVTAIAKVSPAGILGGLGAMSAVLLLVFKDSIMGFVSSIQLSSNDMVRLGDWIEMPKYNADGDVIDITLQSVVVQNWDKTITTIPIYSLVSDSFRNWRGMTQAGGRRIKRSILIDMQSVRFLAAEEIGRLAKLPLLGPYMQGKIAEITEHNAEHNIPENDYISGRHLTNLGTFRAYAETYLKSLLQVAKNMTCMARYLQPDTGGGLPMEIYLFSADTAWVNYEHIQSDIIDHFLAIMGEFGLKAYQSPSGADVQLLAEKFAKKE
jgi:miniconductance mechanosensitive channel